MFNFSQLSITQKLVAAFLGFGTLVVVFGGMAIMPLFEQNNMAVIVPLVLIVSLQKYFVRGVLGGAVKG
ncbi:hypothetical protein D3C87_1889910 [compost metagenome]